MRAQAARDKSAGVEEPLSFWIHRDGTNYGPYTVAHAKMYLRSGDLFPGDLAWDDETKDWIPLKEMLARVPSAQRPARPPLPRKTSVLVRMAIVYSMVFLVFFGIAAAFFAGVVISYVNPVDHDEAVRIAVEVSAAPIVLISLGLAVGLTVAGKLPGTGK